MKQAIEIALRTWYPKDHPLHFNPHHPLGKLLGEWGELLDDYMKSLYKPGYVFEPENELGDIWYYLRILCYQKGYEPDPNSPIFFPNYDTDQLIASAMSHVITAFRNRNNYNSIILNVNYTVLFLVVDQYNFSFDDLTQSNWEKLKPGSERGEQWMKARKT